MGLFELWMQHHRSMHILSKWDPLVEWALPRNVRKKFRGRARSTKPVATTMIFSKRRRFGIALKNLSLHPRPRPKTTRFNKILPFSLMYQPKNQHPASEQQDSSPQRPLTYGRLTI